MRVGVILAARAPVPYLAEALESVLSQEPGPDEVVVVDHGSQPGLEAPADVGVVRLESVEGGPAAARAAGLAVLDTELVALADADDVWEPGKLRAQLAALEAYPEAALCFGRATVIDGSGRETGERLPELTAGLIPADELRSQLYQRNAIPAASALIRLDVLEAVGGFAPERRGGLAPDRGGFAPDTGGIAPDTGGFAPDTGGFAPGARLPAASDWDLWLRLVTAGHSFVCEPAARIRYRRHAGALTADVTRLAEAGLLIHERHRGLVDEQTARRAKAADLETLARGQIRERRYAEAAETLDRAAALKQPAPRERLLRQALTVPGLRAALGRRNPYR
jgi:glycosyltransferase involved in cell wall biosynthesis